MNIIKCIFVAKKPLQLIKN